jgi:hypothetical protein
MTRLHFFAKALQERRDLDDRFLSISPELGQRFSERLGRTLARIEAAPWLYQERKNGVRLANLGPRFREYFVAYRLREDRIDIITVGHVKRRPFYFADRLSSSNTGFE